MFLYVPCSHLGELEAGVPDGRVWAGQDGMVWSPGRGTPSLLTTLNLAQGLGSE